MIFLENVSTVWLIRDLRANGSFISREFLAAMQEYEVRDYQCLKKLIDMQIKPFTSLYFVDRLNRVIKKLERINLLGSSVDLYESNGLEGEAIDRLSVLRTDSEVFGGDLIWTSPFSSQNETVKTINSLSVEKLKSLLGHCVVEHSPQAVENAFINQFYGIGVKRAQQLLQAINFYEEQIKRQAVEVTERDVNLFRMNFFEKVDIVKEELNDIISYLVDYDELVWGMFSSKQKEYVSNPQNAVLRNKLLKTVSNYVTLDEAREGLIRTRVIDRFVIK